MSRDSGLVEKIAETLNIKRGGQEGENVWKSRVIYSAAGRIALCSLWDITEEDPKATIVHFKRRTYREIEVLSYINDELRKMLDGDMDSIVDEIYDIFLKTGYLYHTSNHVEPVPDIVVKVGKTNILRGSMLQENVELSGIGLYSKTELSKQYDTVDSVNEMFHLPRLSLQEFYKKITRNIDWQKFQATEHAEFLRMRPPFSKEYWSRDYDRSGQISLLRIGQPGRYIFYFYRYMDGTIDVSPIPTWMTDDYEYRQIACSILYVQGVLPTTHFRFDGDLVHMHVGYLFPPKIQNFFKLFSWPETMQNFPSDFRRVMSTDVFEIFRDVIENLGYGFAKE